MRRLASWALFPGQNSLWPASGKLQVPGDFALIPQCLITRDHAVLDGVLIKYTASKPQGGPLVVVPPNGNAWESLTDVLALVAEKTGRDVLAFSYRRTSVSVGSVCGTSQAVIDTETALQRAQQLAAGASFAVMGISIGGGCGAAALFNLRKSRVLSATDVDAFAAVHSFSSLPATVSALFPFLGQRIPQLLFPALRMNPLDSTSALAQTATPLSRRLFVVNAQSDAVIRPGATLELSDADQSKLRKRGVAVNQWANVAAFHMDLSSFAQPGSWLGQLQHEKLTCCGLTRSSCPMASM